MNQFRVESNGKCKLTQHPPVETVGLLSRLLDDYRPRTVNRPGVVGGSRLLVEVLHRLGGEIGVAARRHAADHHGLGRAKRASQETAGRFDLLVARLAVALFLGRFVLSYPHAAGLHCRWMASF